MLLCSVVVALIARASVNSADYEYNENQAYPGEEWRKVDLLDDIPTELEYRQTRGLFAITDRSGIQITGVLPACLDDGDIVRRWRNSTSLPIEVTSSPRVELLPPPTSPLHQITFDIPIQAGNTDILGASSYAVYENGEVWCSERVVQRGQAVGVGAAFAAVLQVLHAMAVSFTSSFIIMSVLAIICLELWSRCTSCDG